MAESHSTAETSSTMAEPPSTTTETPSAMEELPSTTEPTSDAPIPVQQNLGKRKQSEFEQPPQSSHENTQKIEQHTQKTMVLILFG